MLIVRHKLSAPVPPGPPATPTAPLLQGREEILRVHIERKGLPLAEDVRVGQLAAQTTGFTGADLANLVNEAALLAGRGDKGGLVYE